MSRLDINGDGKVDYKDALAAANEILDINGDGSVDLKDAIMGLKVALASGGTAGTAGLAHGAYLVASTASSIGATLAATGGSIAGAISGITAGTTTMGALSIANLGSVVVVQSAVAQMVNTGVATAITSATTTAAVAAEAASGYIAGLPIIKSAAAGILSKTGQVVVISGVAIGIHAAIAAGVISLVVCLGVVYFLRSNQEFSQDELEELAELEA